MRAKELFAWIRERHIIYMKREKGTPRPWTGDPILRGYRFCNVYRELDTVTRWIAKNWRAPNRTDPDLWFAMVVARLVNWPDSLAEIGYPVPWSAKAFTGGMDARRERGEKLFTGAYMIHADAVHSGTKAEYLAEGVLTPLWTDRAKVRPRAEDTLEGFHSRLMQYRDMGSFMAAQVVADLKYVLPLSKAMDWDSWAASGAGSRRGLNRVMRRPLKAPWKEVEWRSHVHILHNQIGKLINRANMPKLHAQDLQNCLCEFDKYERVRLGEGRPRSLYNGTEEPCSKSK